jgi:hypothetical protein
LQEIVEVDGLVGAMESADADVHDTLRTVLAVVGRHGDRGWEERQVGGAQPDGRPGGFGHGSAFILTAAMAVDRLVIMP